MSSRRARRYSPLLTLHIHPQLLFLTGGVCVVLYLLQSSLLLRALQVVLFAFLATMNGKRIMFGYFFLMVGSITVFHLFQPMGEVLLRIGHFPITRGAVSDGVFKGMTIIGLVFISLFSIRPNLKLPGTLGGHLAGMLLYFERILEYRGGLTLRSLIASVDTALEELFPPERLQYDMDEIPVVDGGAEPAAAGSDPATEGGASRHAIPSTTALGAGFCLLLAAVNALFIPMGRYLG